MTNLSLFGGFSVASFVNKQLICPCFYHRDLRISKSNYNKIKEPNEVICLSEARFLKVLIADSLDTL